jgi:GT2 family glycosyltransferase
MRTGGKRARTLRVQSVLYGNEPAHVRLSLAHLERAADLAIAAGELASVRVVYGDCSPDPVFGEDELERISSSVVAVSRVEHRFFGENLGSARGHNRLLEDAIEDLVLIMNPDVMLAPDTLLELLRPFRHANTGLVEARQLPVEHPKDYDPVTGDTGWASTACAMVPRKVFQEQGGFDADSFFLYCDDVDFSWRLRLAGLRVIFQPSAVAFHDKRLTDDGHWNAGSAERYYSAEAALFLTYKYSRNDLAENLVETFSRSGLEYLKRAAQTFTERRASGRVPPQLDPDHRVSEFKDGFYARHRFAL